MGDCFTVEKESLKMRFNGSDEIGLETLTDSLNATLDCLKIIADDVVAKDDYCKFVVKNVEKGSFIIDISVIKEVAERLVPFAASIVTILTGIFAIRKHLKGKAPAKIDNKADGNTTIVNADGENQTLNTTVVNVYLNNNDVERKLSQLSSALAKDDARTTLTVEENDDNGGVISSVDYTKNDLQNTSKAVDLTPFQSDSEESINEVWLKIKKLYFQGEAKWDFIMDIGSTTISATVEDAKFLEGIQKGTIYVAAETKLLVKLRSVRKKDKTGQYIGKGQYFVLEVKDIKNPPPEPVQLSMDGIETADD